MVRYKKKHSNRFLKIANMYKNRFDKHGNHIYSFITLPSLGKCKIMINNNESSTVPHFHIINKSGIDIAINIFTPEYNETNGSNYTLTEKDIEILQKFLESEDLYNKGYNVNILSTLYIIWEDLGNEERTDLEFTIKSDSDIPKFINLLHKKEN